MLSVTNTAASIQPMAIRIDHGLRILGVTIIAVCFSPSGASWAADGFIIQPSRPDQQSGLLREPKHAYTAVALQPSPVAVSKTVTPVFDASPSISTPGLSWVKRGSGGQPIPGSDRGEVPSLRTAPLKWDTAGDEFAVDTQPKSETHSETTLHRAQPIEHNSSSTNTTASPIVNRFTLAPSLPNTETIFIDSPSVTVDFENDVKRSTTIQATKVEMASKVSQMIIGNEAGSHRESVVPVGGAAGWDWIDQQVTAHLRRSEHLAQRGVFLSAREEANAALLLLARHLDHLSNGFRSEPGIYAAQTALRESGDFASSIQTADLSILKQIVHSHETPILKQANLLQVSPVTLAEHYRQFAEAKIVEASQNHPWFSDILYNLGRTFQAEADNLSGTASNFYRGQSVVYYRAALAVAPSNALAANQLGYVLLQQDRPLEAQGYLIASVDVNPDAHALCNLVEASRRLGDQRMEQWALKTLAITQNRQQVSLPVPPIQVLDNSSFAAISPMGAGPKSNPISPAASTQVSTTNVSNLTSILK